MKVETRIMITRDYGGGDWDDVSQRTQKFQLCKRKKFKISIVSVIKLCYTLKNGRDNNFKCSHDTKMTRR
jgi:hypothetical protein